MITEDKARELLRSVPNGYLTDLQTFITETKQLCKEDISVDELYFQMNAELEQLRNNLGYFQSNMTRVYHSWIFRVKNEEMNKISEEMLKGRKSRKKMKPE